MSFVTVGTVRVRSVSDGTGAPARPRFFPGVPPEAWSGDVASYLDRDGNVPFNYGSFLVRADGLTLLVDTGFGESEPGSGGQLLANLCAVGIEPDAIDLVLITHMHTDHIGGNTVAREGRFLPAFPRARYLMQRAEWDFWMQRRTEATPHIDDDDERLLPRIALPLAELGVLDLVEGEHAATPSVRFLPTPGHTPGHASILIDSGGERAVILGDVAHSPVQVTEPDWCTGADVDRELARTTRLALWDRIEAEGLIVAAGHFTEPNIDRFVRVEGRRYWQASPTE